jgi:hypothetical protein
MEVILAGIGKSIRDIGFRRGAEQAFCLGRPSGSMRKNRYIGYRSQARYERPSATDSRGQSDRLRGSDLPGANGFAENARQRAWGKSCAYRGKSARDDKSRFADGL